MNKVVKAQNAILAKEGESEVIRLVNKAAEKYFVGNAQILRKLQAMAASAVLALGLTAGAVAAGGQLQGAKPPVVSSPGKSQGTGSWLFRDIRYRVPVAGKTGVYARKEALVRWKVDFAALFKTVGVVDAELDVNSIRVAAMDENGQEKEIPSVFLKDGGPQTKAACGELVWRIPGEIEPLETIGHRVYFDVVGTTPRKAPAYPPIPGAERKSVNLVRNPGFEETGPHDTASAVPQWIPSSVQFCEDATGTISTVHDPRRSGERSLKINCTRANTRPSGASFGCRQERIALKPNSLYRVSVWIRSDPANKDEGLRVLLTAWLFQADGKHVKTSNAKYQTALAPESDDWRLLRTLGLAYRADVLTPPDTGYCNLDIGLCAGNFGVVYIDDVEIVEVLPEDKTPLMEIETGVVEKAGGLKRKIQQK